MNTRHLAHTKRAGLRPAPGFDLIDKSQARNLCGDDIIRHPETGRYVRVSRLNHGEKHVGVIANDVETGEGVVFTLGNRRQCNVYVEARRP